MSLTNRVNASSPVTMTYQWRLNGEPLPGQTKNTIILTNVQISNGGNYDVLVANRCGSVTSRVFTLNVDPTYTQITNDPLVNDTAGGWNPYWIDYDCDGNLDVSIGPRAGALRNTPIYHNEGNGTFRKVTTNLIAQTQVNAHTHTWADYDNDGKLDLFLHFLGYPWRFFPKYQVNDSVIYFKKPLKLI